MQEELNEGRKLVLRGVKFPNVTLSAGSINPPVEIETKLNVEQVWFKSNPRKFVLRMHVDIGTPQNELVLLVRAEGDFETTADIDEAFKVSPFARMSAPAIVFPYVRAFISTLLLGAGYEPIILPTMNFVKLAEVREDGEGNVEVD